MRRFQARLAEQLERELARCRRMEDEAARTVAGMREDINLLRKQAMVLNDDFLRVRRHRSMPVRPVSDCSSWTGSSTTAACSMPHPARMHAAEQRARPR